MSLFKCDICAEKDLRLLDKTQEIERLVAQISHLNKLVFPTQDTTYSKESLEYDRILSGTDTIDVESTLIEN